MIIPLAKKIEKENINNSATFGNSIALVLGNKTIPPKVKAVAKRAENIIFIDNEKKDITPKNAVAKGALMLKGVGVYNHSKDTVSQEVMPISKYIWKYEEVEEEGEDAKAVIKKGANVNDKFKNIGKRDNDIFSIYYSEVSTIEDEDDPNLKSHSITIPSNLLEEINEKKLYDIWIKPYDGDIVECSISNKDGEQLSDSKKFLLNLKTGKIEAKD